MKKNQIKKTTKDAKEFYSFKNYSPNKNAKSIMYKGTKYLSKAQCMALEGITRKELDAYLKGEEPETPVEGVEEDVEELEEGLEEEDELPDDYFDVEDDF